MSPEERESRIQQLEEEIERKRSIVDSKYGAGAFDRGIAAVKPHRCAKHLDELFHGYSKLEFVAPTVNLFKCFTASSATQEVPLLYPSEATSAMLESSELEKLKSLRR
jgi:hypothetical protein